jgi:D-amino-acid oxidase
MPRTYSRRAALQMFATGIATTALAEACARAQRFVPAPERGGRALARVLVGPERLIRQVAGLRPFRRSGFNVSVDAIGEKPVIHNYGHGGGGVALSWGTAKLSTDYAVAMSHRDAAVIGCGAVGLATARLLQDRGFTVTIYARDLPPNTTSNIAGASWAPTLVLDADRSTPAFESQYVQAARYAWAHFQTLAGPTYGVSWRDNYLLSDGAATGFAAPSPERALLAGIRPPFVPLRAGEHPFGTLQVSHSLTMHIEPSVYLPAILGDFRTAGGHVVIRTFDNREDLRAVSQPLIVNCTGLGAGRLFNDPDVLPIKGQLTVLAPQSEVDYLTTGPGDIYMMPRRDGIVLGGTHERDVWSLDPDPVATIRILEAHRQLFARMM